MNEAYKRLYQVAQCSSQTQLAKVLGISQAAVSFSQKRNTIPEHWLLKLAYRKRINPHWVLTGEGEIFLEPKSSSNNKLDSQLHRPLQAYSLEELLLEIQRRVMG